MRIRALIVTGLLAGITSALAAQDLFLTLRDYFVPAQSDVRVIGLNGTFSVSENNIDRVRIADLSLVTPAGRRTLDTAAVGAEGPRTVIRIHTEAEGTYQIGLSTKPSELSQKAAAFNTYLADEGIGPVLAERKRTGELGKPARERYSKHVKMLFQAGSARSDGWNAVLGYPVEIVPLRNPYALGPADTLRFRILFDGVAAPAGQEALAGGRTASGARRTVRHLVTDAAGEVAVPLGSPGTWYLKFIRMTRATEPGIDYISQWATLTFAVARSSGKGQ
jgi:hypothetical protein